MLNLSAGILQSKKRCIMAIMRTSTTPRYPSFMERFLNQDLWDLYASDLGTARSTIPAVNLKENDKNYEIEVAAPGMNREDFKINLDNHRLVISSEHEEESKEEKDEYERREFSYRSFQRSFTIPEDLIDADKIDAKYKDGILHITLPKLKVSKPKQTRNIKVG